MARYMLSSGRMRGSHRTPSLLARVVLALAVVALVPLVLLAAGLIRLNREAMTTQVLRTHSVAARTAAERLAARLEGLAAAARAAASSRGVEDPATAREILAGLVSHRSELVGAAVSDPGGGEVLRVQRRGRGELVQRLLARPPEAVPRLVEEGSAPWLLLDEPLPAEAGWLRLVVDGGALTGVLRPEEIGEEAALAVVDRHGRVLLPPGATGFPRPLVEAAAGGRLAGAGVFPADGGGVLGAWAPVPGTGWAVVSRQPRAVAEAVAGRMRRRAGLALGLGLVLAGGLAAAAYRSLVSPLRRLLAAHRKLEGLAAAPAEGNELALLEESLAVLERRLEDRQELGDVFLGRYQVLGVLGEGAMGTVFRGWDPKLRRPVALKTIRPGRTSAAAEAGELLAEAVAAAQLSHPNVVAVYDVVERGGVGFIAMELIEGESLAHMLRRRRRLDAAEVAALGAGVAQGLAAAHAAGLVHHDIKPGNVLLGFDGSVKLTDFGVARFVTAGAETGGVVFGTPGFIPPEALEGRGYTQLGDLFALGVLLYRCLAGSLPFGGEDLGDVIARTMEGRAVPVARAVPGVPPALAELVMRLISPEPSRRGGSAAAVAGRLEELCTRQGWCWTPPRPEDQTLDTLTEDHHVSHSYLVPTTRLRRDLAGAAHGGGGPGDPGGGAGV